ncbi:class I SAM-dependent methyltransferase [Elusimicrobiota bacterium]
MPDYIKVVYDEKKRPYTDYPQKLCKYLFDIFKMKAGTKFLEVGCGRGEHLSHFKNLGLQTQGLDIVKSSQEYNKELNIQIADVEKDGMPFENSYFDIVYSKSFIEHLYYPEKYMKEVLRVLKPGGLLLTLTPDWEANYKIFFDDYSHRSPFTKYALEDIYKIHGFKEVKVNIFRQLPIAWKFPFLNLFCAAISPFIPIRTKNKFLRWSRELMLIGSGIK